MESRRTPRPRTPAARLTKLIVLLDRHRRIVEHCSSLRAADQRLLWLFTDGRARTLREIAEALALEQSTVNRQVNAAISAGLLQRYRAPGRSAQLVELTTEGLERFENDVSLMLDTVGTALATLGDHDSEQLLVLMERFVESYGDTVTE
ncbi:MarR family winged helix-turn-helix transcriptional regulator [Nocardioides houyundeii]|uniref:MarR family winged helix-turn-helix transcriptional regulator n=1 Tax=Nocardioides houyundeii TaxID=2045452 RepID=UPI000C788434|nr:MarR family winged helix-turn-helix transcriptional regulator [Nocardioides houyundeii]